MNRICLLVTIFSVLMIQKAYLFTDTDEWQVLI